MYSKHKYLPILCRYTYKYATYLPKIILACIKQSWEEKGALALPKYLIDLLSNNLRQSVNACNIKMYVHIYIGQRYKLNNNINSQLGIYPKIFPFNIQIV